MEVKKTEKSDLEMTFGNWKITFDEGYMYVQNTEFDRELKFWKDSNDAVYVRYEDINWTLGNTLELMHPEVIPEIEH